MATAGVMEWLAERVRPREASLSELLAQQGIEVVPTQLVRCYQKDVVARIRSRAGWWGRHPTITRLVLLGWILALCGLALGFSIGWFVVSWKVGVASLGLAVGMSVLTAVMPADDVYNIIENGLAHWRRIAHGKFGRLIPQSVNRQIATAKDIPGVAIEIEELAGDPFVFATRRKGFGRQREWACIGYWEAPEFDLILLQYEFVDSPDRQ